MNTRICHHKNCIHNQIARPISDFIRKNKNGGMVVHRICNDCSIRSRIVPLERINRSQVNWESLIPKSVKKLSKKPVWLVIYKSYWP